MDSVILLNRPEKHFLESFYYAKIKSGIDAALEGSSYGLAMSQQDAPMKEHDGPRPKFAGVLNIAPHVNHPSIGFLAQEKIPAVLINCRSPHVSWVDVDNVRGGMTMTDHLVKLGHKKILYVNGFTESQNGMDRLKGYKLALEKNGIPFDPRLVVDCDFSVTLAYERMRKLLEHNLKLGFTAVFASNDYMAVGAIRALSDENIRVPGDIAVVGFDDFDFASSFFVPLTTYRQPFQNIGFLAAKMLLKQMTAKAVTPETMELIGEIVIRDSCGWKKAMETTRG